jgi:GNAT superfamily N-acetyltransferase
MSNSNYIYHGTSVGATLHIQRDGYIKPNNVGEKYPSISFTSKLDYAKYYAKAKGGNTNSIILRTKLTDKFKLSNRIRNNKGFEYITYDKIPIDQVEILHDDNWYKLKDWDLIDNKLIENNISSKITYTNEVIDAYSNQINCEAGVYLNGDIVGYVQYVLYNGELTISNIFIHPSYRRMGFASRLFKYITQENPKYKYKGSLKTDLGSKLKYKRNISLTDNKLFDRCATRLHESQNQVIIGKMEQHFKDCSKKYFKEHYGKFKYPTFKIRLNIKNAGHYLPDTNEIVLNKDMANDDMQLKSTVYHETIHYYQNYLIFMGTTMNIFIVKLKRLIEVKEII